MGFVLVTGLSKLRSFPSHLSHSGRHLCQLLEGPECNSRPYCPDQLPSSLLHHSMTPSQPPSHQSLHQRHLSRSALELLAAQAWALSSQAHLQADVPSWSQPGPVPKMVADAQVKVVPLDAQLTGSGLGEVQAASTGQTPWGGGGSLQSPESPWSLQCPDKLLRTMYENKSLDNKTKDKYYKACILYKPWAYLYIKPKRISPTLYFYRPSPSGHMCLNILVLFYTLILL